MYVVRMNTKKTLFIFNRYNIELFRANSRYWDQTKSTLFYLQREFDDYMRYENTWKHEIINHETISKSCELCKRRLRL